MAIFWDFKERGVCWPSFRSTHILYHAPTLLQARLATFFNFFSLTLVRHWHSTACVVKKNYGRGDGPCIYKVYARARKVAAAAGPGGVLAVVPGGGAPGGVLAVVPRWPITTHDTFISIRAKNAQYSTALPYVKSRQIAKNRLVLPNWKLVANRRSRKVVTYHYTS